MIRHNAGSTPSTKPGRPWKVVYTKTLVGESQDVSSALAYAILKIDRNELYNLSRLDWAVVVAYFIMMVLIGVYYSKKNKSFKDFALGGKTMGSFSVGLSLFATMLSSLSYLSYPGEMIRYGSVIFTGMFAFPITHWVVGWYIIPKFMKEDVSSAYELLEKKFGVSIRIMASFNLGSFLSWIPDHWLAHWSPLKWGFNATERLTIGNAILMLFIWYICTAGSDQMAIQRDLPVSGL